MQKVWEGRILDKDLMTGQYELAQWLVSNTDPNKVYKIILEEREYEKNTSVESNVSE